MQFNFAKDEHRIHILNLTMYALCMNRQLHQVGTYLHEVLYIRRKDTNMCLYMHMDIWI